MIASPYDLAHASREPGVSVAELASTHGPIIQALRRSLGDMSLHVLSSQKEGARFTGNKRINQKQGGFWEKRSEYNF